MIQVNIIQLNPIMMPLVQKLYKQYYKSSKAKKNELIYVAYVENELCGVLRFKEIDRYRLLTGMLVIPKYRELGIAHQMLEYCRNHVLKSEDYCFAYSNLKDFYQQHGFNRVETDDLPPPLRSLFARYTQSGKSLCPMRF